MGRMGSQWREESSKRRRLTVARNGVENCQKASLYYQITNISATCLLFFTDPLIFWSSRRPRIEMSFLEEVFELWTIEDFSILFI